LRDAGGRGSLTGRLVGGAALGAIAVAIVLVVLVRSIVALTDAQEATARSERLLAEATQTEKLAVDLETGLRGYLITAERRFLAPYERSGSAIPAQAARLRRLSDLPAQRARAARIERQIGAYLRDYARPLATGPVPARNTREATALAAEGKRRLDALRGEIARFTAVERRRLARRSAAAERDADQARIVAFVALGGLVGLLVLLTLYVNRTIVRPVRALGSGVARLRAGDLGARVGRPGPHEIGAVGAAIDDLASSLATSRAQVEDQAAELRRFGERNLLLLDTVFAQTPAGLAFLDRDLRHVRVNAALAAITGLPVEAHVGRLPEEISPGVGDHAMPHMRRVLETGETIAGLELTGETAADPGVAHTWSLTVFPVRDDGEVAGVGLVVEDVTERRRAETEREAAYAAERRAREAAETARGRAAYLAEAGAVLDASLDLDETLSGLARLSVPRVADWCSIELLAPGGRIRNAAVAHPDPARLALASELQRRYPVDPTSPSGAPAVIRSGRPELYPDIPEELLELGASDAEHLALIRELGMVSAMVVPLTARGSTLGAITFVAAESGRRFGDEDLALAQDLAARAALAIDNARLYRDRTHVAQTLQASLLPDALPDIPGVRLAARYEPLGSGTEVGGDFYDVFAVGDGRWALVIGDVCGKGAEAATLTALARYTLRAVTPLAPVEALRRLNSAILRQRDDLRFITLIYAELDLRDGAPRFTYASGGHPPALLVHPTGPGEVLDCQGTLIGVTPEPKLTECSVELGAGDTVALYTDGVAEASHADPLDGAQLLSLLDGARSAEGVADRLVGLARTGDGAGARDDVAILALELEG
jgi:PAS domain S-box-containing protein